MGPPRGWRGGRHRHVNGTAPCANQRPGERQQGSRRERPRPDVCGPKQPSTSQRSVAESGTTVASSAVTASASWPPVACRSRRIAQRPENRRACVQYRRAAAGCPCCASERGVSAGLPVCDNAVQLGDGTCTHRAQRRAACQANPFPVRGAVWAAKEWEAGRGPCTRLRGIPTPRGAEQRKAH
ncbi:hypothetical protein TRVL_04286 [Trypanosoma vivax]|nr:hypothetical protein TRVL_04286 [Trypanosoma vivax]